MVIHDIVEQLKLKEWYKCIPMRSDRPVALLVSAFDNTLHLVETQLREDVL